MKKLLVLILVLVPVCGLVALDLGFGVDLFVDSYTDKIDSDKATELWFRIEPALVLRLTPKLDLQPSAVVGMYKYNDPVDDEQANFFGAGVGLFYRAIDGQIVDLVVGPKVRAAIFTEPTGTLAFDYDSYFELGAELLLPVFLDVRLTQNLFMRAGVPIPIANLYIYSRESLGIKETETEIVFTDYFSGGLVVYIGFYFMLP